MTDYLVVNDVSDDGMVLGMWPRATSDNSATAIADGKLTVDGEDVLIGIDPANTTLIFSLMTDPTEVAEGCVPFVLNVDDPGAPGDTYGIGTPGNGRDGKYYGDTDDLGMME